jgi:hypothetical protein
MGNELLHPVGQRAFELDHAALAWFILHSRNAGDIVADARADEAAIQIEALERGNPEFLRNMIERRREEFTQEEYEAEMDRIDAMQSSS